MEKLSFASGSGMCVSLSVVIWYLVSDYHSGQRRASAASNWRPFFHTHTRMRARAWVGGCYDIR